MLRRFDLHYWQPCGRDKRTRPLSRRSRNAAPRMFDLAVCQQFVPAISDFVQKPHRLLRPHSISYPINKHICARLRNAKAGFTGTIQFAFRRVKYRRSSSPARFRPENKHAPALADHLGSFRIAASWAVKPACQITITAVVAKDKTLRRPLPPGKIVITHGFVHNRRRPTPSPPADGVRPAIGGRYNTAFRSSPKFTGTARGPNVFRPFAAAPAQKPVSSVLLLYIQGTYTARRHRLARTTRPVFGLQMGKKISRRHKSFSFPGADR